MATKVIFSITTLFILQVALSNDVLQGIVHVPPNTPELEINEMAFSPIQNYYGHIGPLFYDILTNENCLGNEMSKASKIIENFMGIENMKLSFEAIYKNSQYEDLAQISSDIYEKIKNIQIPETGEKFSDAITIIMNIFSDPKKVKEIRQRIVKKIK